MTTLAPLATRIIEGVEIPSAGTYALDLAHTRVGFTVKHLMVSKVRGNFGAFDGTVVIDEDPRQSSVAVTIQTASINTGQAQRDEHLRTGDFFEAETFPTIAFRSTGLDWAGGTEFTLPGQLTIKGVTRPVELTVEFEGVARNPWGQEVAGFTAHTEIDREDFGLTYNQALETGGVMIGKKVRIEIEAEAVRQA
jgi:polyisoprenoid-binding protein YceI